MVVGDTGLDGLTLILGVILHGIYLNPREPDGVILGVGVTLHGTYLYPSEPLGVKLGDASIDGYGV